MNKMMTSEQLFSQLLEILCVFDRLCNKTGIQYSLYGGTLLGAVREHNFIPWDDDADVFMTRENFKQLEKELNNSKSDYYIRGKIKKQFCRKGNPHIWIDIFICDFISDNCISQKVKQSLLAVLDVMHRNRKSIKLSNLNQYSAVKRFVYKIAFTFGYIIPKSWTEILYIYISEKCFLGKRKNMFRSNDQYSGRKLVFPAEWMEKYEKIDIAGQSVWIIEKWDPLLIQCYGDKYTVPIRNERNMRVHDLVRSEEITL